MKEIELETEGYYLAMAIVKHFKANKGQALEDTVKQMLKRLRAFIKLEKEEDARSWQTMHEMAMDPNCALSYATEEEVYAGGGSDAPLVPRI